MTPNRGGGGGVLSPCLNKETAKKAAESLHDGVVQAKAARWTEEANDGMAKTTLLPPPRSWALRSPVCLNQGSLNPSARVQMLTPALPPLPPVVLRDQPNARVSHQQQSRGDKTHKPP